jgi:transcriptional regulator with XRE-family HTH domain
MRDPRWTFMQADEGRYVDDSIGDNRQAWAPVMDDKTRAAALRAFLLERRARLKPQDVGLPSYGIRRCPGLRREEVAELAGVSAAWYTLFETARPKRRPSLRMVERVASALRLEERDRAHLYYLALPEIGRILPLVARVVESSPAC